MGKVPLIRLGVRENLRLLDESFICVVISVNILTFD